MTEQLKVEVTRTIPAPVKTVFEAWLTPEAVKNFMCPMEGVIIPVADINPEENGKFSIVMKAGGTEIPINGEYKKINRYSELAFSWLSAHTTEQSVVSLTFKELSENETELKLVHTGFPSEEARNNHDGGWNRIVDLLSKFII